MGIPGSGVVRRAGGVRPAFALRGGVIGVAVWLMAASWTQAQGTRYIDAYNILVSNLNLRTSLGPYGTTRAFKSAAAGDRVTQGDLHILRSAVERLMTDTFLMGPSEVRLDQSAITNAFVPGLRRNNGVAELPTLLECVGDKRGRWTKVPAEFTTNGLAVYTNLFDDVSPLWVHFDELDKAIRSLRCGTLPYGTPAAWTNNGEMNVRSGWGEGTNWAAAWSAARAVFDGGFVSGDNNGPAAHSHGHGASQGFPYTASILRRYSYYKASQLTTAIVHNLRFYVSMRLPTEDPGVAGPRVFDTNGDDVRENQWTYWCQSGWMTSSNVLSERFGGTWRPDQCGEPAIGGNVDYRGYETWQPFVMVEWKFPDAKLVRPPDEDVDDDGIIDQGCDCQCPLETDMAWAGTHADGRVHIPLGLSSGVASAGLRVKAYLTEYTACGMTQQMYSLSTRITTVTENSAEGWAFVSVQRPVGAEVTFSIHGRKPGAPVEGRREYRMAQIGPDSYRIIFPRKKGSVCHRFWAQQLTEVGRMQGTNWVLAIWSGVKANWPGLTTTFDGWAPNAAIVSVDTPLLLALPIYTNGLAGAVEYRYKDGTTNIVQAYKGSRGFRTRNGQGQPICDMRLATDESNGVVEIWRGITTNADLQVALKERREEWYDPDTDSWVLKERHIAYDGLPNADSNTARTVSRLFPWGYERISRTEGDGTPEARMTGWSYHTNIVATGPYGKIRMVENPDGAWTMFDYDDQGRMTVERSGFGDALPGDTNLCVETEWVYYGDPRLADLGMPAAAAPPFDYRPRLEIGRVLGRETARTYRAFEGGVETVKRCVEPGARYDATNNMATVTWFVTSGSFAGRPLRIERPDGTRSVYAYALDGSRFTATEDRGSGPGTSVTNGTRHVTVSDAAERVVSITVTDIGTGFRIAGTDYVRDGYGRVLTASNRVDGTVTRTTYACCGPEMTVDGDGTVTHSAYDALKRPYATERNGVTTYTDYNARGMPVETRDTVVGLPDRVTRLTYDAAGRLVKRVDARGGATRYAYGLTEAGGKVVTVTQPDGAATVMSHYRDGQLRSITGTAARAVCVAQGVDETGPYATEYRGADTNAAEWVRIRTDMLGRVWRVEYPDGYASEARYDSAGRLVRDGDGLSTRLVEYDDMGVPVRYGIDMDGNGQLDLVGTDRIRETVTGYGVIEGRNAEKVEQRILAADGSATRTTMAELWRALDGTAQWVVMAGRTARVDVARSPQSVARRETETDFAGASTVTTYTNGLPVRFERRDATGAVIAVMTAAYDGYGRLRRVTDTAPDGTSRTRTCDYDAGGLVTNEVIEAGGLRQAVRSEYDAAGRRVRTVLPDGGVVEQAYEGDGALSAQWGSRVYPVRYGYDAQGRLSELRTYRNGTNGPPDVTRWLYDAQRGWLTAKVFADGVTNAFVYAPNGRLARKVGGRGVAVDYAYDAMGIPTNIAYSDGTPGIRLSYDRVGRIVRAEDASGVHSNAYAANGQVVLARSEGAGVETAYAYDGVGRITGVTARTTGGQVMERAGYGFDAAGRVKSAAGMAASARYAYAGDSVEVAGWTVSGAGGDVLGVTRQFDALGRQAAVTWQTNGAAWAQVAREFNAADQVERRVEPGGRVWEFGYDDLGQLTSAVASAQGGGTAAVAGVSFAYDTIGNRTTMIRDDGRNAWYTVNGLNQYIGLDYLEFGVGGFRGTIYSFGAGDGPTLQAAAALGATNAPLSLVMRRVTPEYDADGNLLRDGAQAYTWDAENRLVMVEPLARTAGVRRVRYGYDYLSRRAWRGVDAWDGAAWTRVETNRYAYDGWRVLAEVNERAAGTTTNTYVWGLDVSGTFEEAAGVGGLLFGRFAGAAAPVAYAYDDNGNVIGLVDTASGAVAAGYEYGAYGELLQATGPAAALNPFRFSTRLYEDEAGLVLYPARAYSLGLGRFLGRDPIEEAGGANLYAYVGNHPLDSVDPFGMEGLYGSGHVPGIINQVTVPIRLLGGYAGGVITGDAFSFESADPQYDADQCEFLITVSGIRMQEPDIQERFMNRVADLEMFTDMRNPAWVNNPSRYHTVGDLVQIALHELVYALDVTAMRAARKIESAARAAERNGCVCWCITVVAHSQGTMVVKRALDVIDPEIKRHVSLIGLGGETTFGPGDGVAYAVNVAHINDPVTHKWNKGSPWNGHDRVITFGVKHPGEGSSLPDYETARGSLFNYDAHSWDKVYLRYLEDHPQYVPRCEAR